MTPVQETLLVLVPVVLVIAGAAFLIRWLHNQPAALSISPAYFCAYCMAIEDGSEPRIAVTTLEGTAVCVWHFGTLIGFSFADRTSFRERAEAVEKKAIERAKRRFAEANG